MVFDTNAVIAHVRRQQRLPVRAVLPIVVIGELKAFALKSNWGYQRVEFLEYLLEECPAVAIIDSMTDLYARLDAYSQGKLSGLPLPYGLTARNMGKNDLWIAATALYLDMPLHTADKDFDHLLPLGLTLVREPFK
ncbi:PIN domain-containing protein [Hymenobacter sp. ASUV-10]|uniref:PIN domain-containing protein n=1 Tax=Hymenobacter aranciens TaxID=3063996 RepID=A0ABT9B763_9BACT|nr:PIN domain-containing protein [Hymenobacter sp. ASUV-10]MDO7874055.1 PIN domain-containing protein [Hymenobacter sp. ASUV-10]